MTSANLVTAKLWTKIICGICFVACATLSIYFAYLEAFANAEHADFHRRASFISLVAAVCFVGYQAIGFVIIRILDGIMGGCTFLRICLLPCTEEEDINLPFNQDRNSPQTGSYAGERRQSVVCIHKNDIVCTICFSIVCTI